VESAEKGIMRRKPRPRSEGVFAGGFGLQILLQGMMFAALTLIGFLAGWRATGDLTAGRTMAFLVLSLTQVFHSFNMRSTRSLFAKGPFTNKALVKAAIVSTLMIAVIIFVEPIAKLFELVMMPWYMYLIAVGLAFVPVPVMEFTKLLLHRKHPERQ
jgi:Ca2+-transporting ATPase